MCLMAHFTKAYIWIFKNFMSKYTLLSLQNCLSNDRKYKARKKELRYYSIIESLFLWFLCVAILLYFVQILDQIYKFLTI